MGKSTVEEIRERFDRDVERFSNIQTGQSSTIDAPVSLELITEVAKSIRPEAKELLDIGCGAGNYTLKMLAKLPNLNCTLVDLSMSMLQRASERVKKIARGNVAIIHSDIREAILNDEAFDIILAGAVLHHLRDDNDWETTFEKLYHVLKPGGCLMISDLVSHDTPAVQEVMWHRYAGYLQQLASKEYQEKVFAYIEKEDSPRSLDYQINLMKEVGFSSVEVLHKNTCFATFCGIK